MTERSNDKDLSRRQLLKAAAVLGVATAGTGLMSLVPAHLAGQADAAGQEGEVAAKHSWVMVIDLRKCDACDLCVEACQTMHYLPKSQHWIKVLELEGASGQPYSLPMLCMQCDNPPCLRVCPVGATFKDPEGITLVNQDTCIGCRMCMAACPYGARTFNWDEPPQPPTAVARRTPEYPVPQVKGSVGKCVMCVHNLRVGKLPACVDACSMDALYVGDRISDLASNRRETVKLSTFLKENNAFRLKEELNTQPRVYFIAGHGELLDH